MKRLFLLVPALLSVCGCIAVYTREPVGETPKNITANRDQWTGTWIKECGPVGNVDAITVRVTDSTNGLLQLAWVENGTLAPRGAEVRILDGQGCVFANLRLTSGDNTNQYFWARFQLMGDLALAWAPDGHKFFEWVKAGEFPGVCTNHAVILGQLSSNQLARLVTTTNDMPYIWDRPFVLRKAK